jgi:hypothetical protein
MYSTCLHCLAPLGRNDAVEAFPVGRRIAYDQERGRLWAVCPQCGRWNLAPLSDRWAAVEECERCYRGTYQRYGTAHIGLAALRDGTELVRIGAALRPEVASWRYGAQLLRRRTPRRDALVRAATAFVGAGSRASRWLGSRTRAAQPEEQVWRLAAHLMDAESQGERVLAVVRFVEPASRAWPGNDTPVAIVRRRHAASATLLRPERGQPWLLEIAHEHGPIRFAGADGLRTAAKLLASVNRFARSAELVAAAVRKVDEAMQPDGYFRRTLNTAWRWQWGRSAAAIPALCGPEPDARRTHDDRTGDRTGDRTDDLAVQLTGRAFWAHGGIGSAERMTLFHMPVVDRLALEMVAHEEAERTALDEELLALEAAWRDAEEIAAIADAL